MTTSTTTLASPFAPHRGATHLPSVDLAAFAKSNPWLGAPVGTLQSVKGGWAQQYQAATVYLGDSTPFEVHGAIRDKYVQSKGPDGVLGLPISNETVTPDGKGRYNHFEWGSIYWHPATGAAVIYGAIRANWASLGWEQSWLGYPLSDENAFTEGDGRVSAFQKGAIYWWPDSGAYAVGDVVVRYTGVHCFGETDVDGLGSNSDEPYATIGVAGPDGPRGPFQSQIYSDVDQGEGRFQVMELYRGKPRGLMITTILQEHSNGDTSASRALTKEAVDKGGIELAKAATLVPVIGPVLGPLASAVIPLVKGTIVDALDAFIEKTLGFADRPLGSSVIDLSAKQMIRLVAGPDHHTDSAIPWRFETGLLKRFGATYSVYFDIVPA